MRGKVMSNTYIVIWKCEECGSEDVYPYIATDNDLPEIFNQSTGRPSREKLRGAYKTGVEGSICKKCQSEALPIAIADTVAN